MKPVRETYIVGVKITPFIGKGSPDFVDKRHPDFGKKENPTLEEQLGLAVRGLFEECGIDPKSVQRAYVGNFAGELFSNQGHMGAMLGRVEPALAGIGSVRLEAACASGGVAMVAGVEALAAGLDVVLVAGAEVQTTVRARQGADYLARAAHYELERPIDEFTFPAMFARRMKAYSEAHGVNLGEFAHFTVKALANASKNPLAHMRKAKMTLEQAQHAGDHNPNFLANEELQPFLKVSDCSQVTDGAAALVLATEEGLKKLGKKASDCVKLKSYAVVTNPLAQVEDLLEFDTAKKSFAETLSDGGASIDDVDVMEVHDCFTIAECLMMEAAGLAPKGHGIEAVKSGKTRLDGDLPVNTGGGLVGFGHPVGATGIKQAAEIFRQMKGQCGDYQMKQAPKLGVMANMGGDDRTCVTALFENVD